MKSAFEKVYSAGDYKITTFTDDFISIEKNKYVSEIGGNIDLYPKMDRLLLFWEFNHPFEHSEFGAHLNYGYYVKDNIYKMDLLLENFMFCMDICEKEIVDKFHYVFDLK